VSIIWFTKLPNLLEWLVPFWLEGLVPFWLVLILLVPKTNLCLWGKEAQTPMMPGTKTSPSEDVKCVAWNQQVRRVLLFILRIDFIVAPFGSW
jgi:hypothetical protein